MPKIRVTTRDNEQLQFDCAPDQTLLDAAAAANVFLPSQCRQGSCGACHANVTAGDYVLGVHDGALLNGGAGGILLCRTTPCSDLDIVLPYDRARILTHTPKRRSAEIVALETVARDTVRLELRLEPDEDSGSAAEFEPGQFMELEIPGSTERRAYSLANTPNWDGRLEFFIRLQPGGRFSDFLRGDAKAGDKLGVHGPFGAFGINGDGLRPVWCVAGGTGLAPILSILRRMAEFQDMRESRLFFGANREDELFAVDALWRLGSELPGFKAEICVWHPSGGWHGFTGTAVEALAEALAAPPVQPDIYVCGPAPLIDATHAAAAKAGIPATQVFSERY
jgi:ferredoxin-NADP reductase/ferredoxin